MSVSISRLGPDATDHEIAQALVLTVALAAEYDPALDPDTETLFRAALVGTDAFQVHKLVAWDGDKAVGSALMRLHHLDSNADKAEAEIEVHPGHRRQGVATALLDATLDVIETAERRSLIAMNVNSPQAGAFWTAMGAEQKVLDRQSRLWVGETDAALMDRWIAQRDERAGGYRLEHYRGLTPPHLRAAAAELNTAMNDAPVDDLDWDDQVWTEADVLELDSLFLSRGRDLWSTIVLGPNDEPAGLTVVSIQHEKPRFAHQGNTAVHPEHRGQGIGRWLKADMWRRLCRDASFVAAIDTDNAISNDPMLAINSAMGFRPLVDWSTWQADTTVLRR